MYRKHHKAVPCPPPGEPRYIAVEVRRPLCVTVFVCVTFLAVAAAAAVVIGGGVNCWCYVCPHVPSATKFKHDKEQREKDMIHAGVDFDKCGLSAVQTMGGEDPDRLNRTAQQQAQVQKWCLFFCDGLLYMP